MKEEFFMGVYCPPCPPVMDLPSRITGEVYSLLKRIGIKHIYGMYEDASGDGYLEQALNLCAEHGLLFYPRMTVFDRFLDNKENEKMPLFFTLPEAEREAIKAEFTACMKQLNKHPGFGGILISDERSYEAFDGMGVASNLFAECCPDKEFHYNALNYFGDDIVMFYRSGDTSNRELRLVGDLEYNAENRFNRYKVYLDKYLDTCKTNHLSTDVYPFSPTWKEVPTSIHRALYETSTILANYKQERDIICYHCVQVGDWDLSFREIGRAETALHMNISAAYQLDGYIFFPGVFPNDWLFDEAFKGGAHGETGLLDATGKPTRHYAYVERLIEHAQACAPILLNAEWLGVCTVGEFVGGFGDVELDKVEWNECIYQGGLPENEVYQYTEELPDIETTSQLFIGVFKEEKNKIYWIVNNSIATNVTFKIENLDAWRLIADGKRIEGNGTIKVTELNAGESILLVAENDEMV